MSRMIIKVDGKAYDVEIEVLEEDAMEVHAVQNVAPAVNTAKSTSNMAPIAKPKPKKQGGATMEGNILKSPINGVVLEVPVKIGSQVKEGDVVIILEAMKMKTNIYAPTTATIAEINVRNGDNVESGQSLVVFE